MELQQDARQRCPFESLEDRSGHGTARSKSVQHESRKGHGRSSSQIACSGQCLGRTEGESRPGNALEKAEAEIDVLKAQLAAAHAQD